MWSIGVIAYMLAVRKLPVDPQSFQKQDLAEVEEKNMALAKFQKVLLSQYVYAGMYQKKESILKQKMAHFDKYQKSKLTETQQKKEKDKIFQSVFGGTFDNVNDQKEFYMKKILLNAPV